VSDDRYFGELKKIVEEWKYGRLLGPYEHIDYKRVPAKPEPEPKEIGEPVIREETGTAMRCSLPITGVARRTLSVGVSPSSCPASHGGKHRPFSSSRRAPHTDVLRLVDVWNMRDRVVYIEACDPAAAVNIFERYEDTDRATMAAIEHVFRVISTVSSPLTPLQDTPSGTAFVRCFAVPPPVFHLQPSSAFSSTASKGSTPAA